MFSVMLTVFVTLFDQITKHMALSYFVSPGLRPDIELIPDVFHLRLGRNPGIAFSMLDEGIAPRVLFMVLTTVIIIALLILMFSIRGKKRHRLLDTALSLVLAGGIGNMIDRIFYGEELFFGEVIDFLYFKLIDFPIFNIADTAVCVGVALFAIYLIFFDGKKEGEFSLLSEKQEVDPKSTDDTPSEVKADADDE